MYKIPKKIKNEYHNNQKVIKTSVRWVKMIPLPQPVPKGCLLGLPSPRPSTLGLGRAWRALEEMGKGWRRDREAKEQ